MAQNARSTSPYPIHVRMLFYAQLNMTAPSASTFYVVGAFPSNISRQFNTAFSTLIFSHFNFVRLQFISSFHQNIAFIIPVLTTLLQLKYQGINDQNNKTSTPFATHPTTMLVAVSSCVVYCLAYIALLRLSQRSCAVVAHHCLVWSGYASVASLASLLLPDSVSHFVCAIFVVLPAGELLFCLYRKLVVDEGADFQAYGRGVRRLLNNICRVVPTSSRQRPQILPI